MTAELVISQHSELGGLTADDHVNYLYLPGRAGGQVAIGGTIAANLLTLQDNVANANQITFGTGISGGLLDGVTGSNDLKFRHMALGGPAPTNTHILYAQELFTGTGTRQALGLFPTYKPSGVAVNNLYAVQGNIFFGTANWAASSVVNALQFFPAPDYALGSTVFGSANLKLIGVSTGGCINVLTKTITADTLVGISATSHTFIFGGPGAITANTATAIYVASPAVTTGTIGIQTGIRIDKQLGATRNMGIWIAADNSTIIPPLDGADIVFGAGKDAAIYYNATHLVIDPDVAGGGRVLIGATGDDDMLLNDIEIDGDLNHDGSNIGFYGTAPTAQSAAYNITNVVADRAYDANATTVNELADALGTLIADLQLTGIIG